MSDTHDCTRLDYAFTPEDGGQQGRISCWSGRKPREGDYLLLRNGERDTRYQVASVDLRVNVDPPTMWMARLVFAPRQ